MSKIEDWGKRANEDTLSGKWYRFLLDNKDEYPGFFLDGKDLPGQIGEEHKSPMMVIRSFHEGGFLRLKNPGQHPNEPATEAELEFCKSMAKKVSNALLQIAGRPSIVE